MKTFVSKSVFYRKKTLFLWGIAQDNLWQEIVKQILYAYSIILHSVDSSKMPYNERNRAWTKGCQIFDSIWNCIQYQLIYRQNNQNSLCFCGTEDWLGRGLMGKVLSDNNIFFFLSVFLLLLLFCFLRKGFLFVALLPVLELFL